MPDRRTRATIAVTNAIAATIRVPLRVLVRRGSSTVSDTLYLAGIDVERLAREAR
jgi:hypothetical protein